MGTEGSIADLSSNQKALVVGVVIAAVGGMLYFAQIYQGDSREISDSVPVTAEQKAAALESLEVGRTEPVPSQEEKMRILEQLERQP